LNGDRWRRHLEVTSNLVMIVTGIVVCTYLWGSAHSEHRDAPAAAYQVGERLGPDEGIPGNPGRPILALAVRSTCEFCTASMPFYQRLAKVAESRGVTRIVLGSEPEETVRGYLSSGGVEIDSVSMVGQKSRLASRTPTLALTDSAGRVIGCWTGRLTEDQEHEVERALMTIVPAKAPE